MISSPRNEEAELVLATSRPYLEMSTEELKFLFEEALDAAEARGLPYRGTSDRSFWGQALDRLKKEVAKQEVAASATAGLAASQAVDWAHAIGLDLSDYNLPIAILVALVVKAVWGQMNSESDPGTDHNEQQKQ